MTPKQRGPFGSTRLEIDQLSEDYQMVGKDLKAKVWTADNGDKLLFLRIRDSDDGRRFNEFSIEIIEQEEP